MTTRLLLRESRPPRCRCQVRLQVIAGGRAVICPGCRAIQLLSMPPNPTKDPRPCPAR
jgi:hypothetical protein